MAWYPGAIRKEITKFRTPLLIRRGVCLHVAVSEGSSLYSFFSGAAVCSHFYVRKDGTVEQYVDTKYQAPANLYGNKSLISVETQGGVRNADSEPWTAAQVESLAKICAWANQTHGIPLVQMPDSKPTTKGVGYHRLGVDPYRVDGGEKWSNAYGKVCPGAAKIKQVPAVIARARALAGETLPDTGELFTVSQYEDILEAIAGVREQVGNVGDNVTNSRGVISDRVINNLGPRLDKVTDHAYNAAVNSAANRQIIPANTAVLVERLLQVQASGGTLSRADIEDVFKDVRFTVGEAA
ncbi:peptidoglycan recognition protein family protein [Jiangella anatolica]|uniref:N-acetylmuramoyl-L-alanine amidase domain-containing protein n=1 Tax=Jiangella anatolica TaxID=2670374 RepID=A0A2W2BFT4_9ACTN|nr:peptidoglycan recognition family protein [Jiangella anatolica]PZF84150.1 hypothetical protein C1I92_09885 [Jiangella anatolica]